MYYCHLETSAIKANLFSGSVDDIFDLSKLPNSDFDRKLLLEYDLKCNNKGYLEYCRNCHGCSDVNEHYVKPAIQKTVF